MYSAYDSNDNLVYANNASWGIYWCTECGQKAHYREPSDKSPHFYHFEYNPHCSKSSEVDDGSWIYNEIRHQLNKIQGTNTQDWIYAIEALWKLNCLDRLEGKNWAKRPIIAYLSKVKHPNEMDNIQLINKLYEILHAIISYKDFESFENGNTLSPELLKNLTASATGSSALISALNGKAPNIAELLIDNGSNVNTCDSNNTSVLSIAAANGYVDIVRKLIKKNTNIDSRDNDGKTSLICSLLNGHIEIAKLLISNESDSDISDNNTVRQSANAKKRRFPFLQSLFRPSGPSVKVAALQINKVADVNLSDNNGNTPLSVAAANDYLEFVDVLIKKNANINAQDKDGNTPILHSLLNQHLKITELLVRNGADINIPNNSGNTPLSIASANGFYEMVELIVSKNANINIQDKDGNTPILHSLLNQHLKIAEFFIRNGADFNIASSNGNTPLSVAVTNDFSKFVEIFISRNAHINIQDKDGKSLLLQSLLFKKYETAKLLINKGINVNLVDSDGRAPLLIALLNTIQARLKRNQKDAAYHFKIIELLINHDAKKNIKLSRNALNEAFSIYNVNLDTRFFDAYPLLMLSLYGNHFDIAECLIIGNANLNSKSTNGRTPLMWANEFNKIAIVDFLRQNGGV